jgi:hypothetical protein
MSHIIRLCLGRAENGAFFACCFVHQNLKESWYKVHSLVCFISDKFLNFSVKVRIGVYS